MLSSSKIRHKYSLINPSIIIITPSKKVIRATIKVEVPYSNDALNNGTLLDNEIRKVIDRTEFISCGIQAGYLDPDAPVLK